MSLTFANLKTELAARGFDYLSTTRLGYFLNRAYQELCEEQDWEWLEASSSGVAPLAVTDLRTVESVVDATTLTKLTPIDRRTITDADPTLVVPGMPSFYYITDQSTINVYPVNTVDTISVRYWKVPDDLSADADEPLIPNRFRLILVDGAAVYAYFDTDNFDAAQGIMQLWEQGKARMRDSLLVNQHDQPSEHVVVTSWDD